MAVLNSKHLDYKNINILKEETDKKFNLYTLINNKNNLLNNVTFRTLKDCKNFIDKTLESEVLSDDIPKF